MFIEGIASQMAASGGIQAAESRMRSLEAMVSSLNPTPTQTSAFQNVLRQQKTGPRQLSFEPMIQAFSAQHEIDPALVSALVKQESGFNPQAISKAGAMGLMQLMPGTAKGLGVIDPMDPAQNLEGGIRHLKGLLSRYNGNIPLALAAYNAGAGAVAKYQGVPPYKETQQYVRNILSMYLQAKNA